MVEQDFSQMISETVKRLNENTRRIRVLEQSFERLEDRISKVEESVLAKLNELKLEFDKICIKMNSILEKIKFLEDETIRINKELEKKANKAELKEFENFIELINPITSKFVTLDQVERIVEERIPKKAKIE